MLEHKINQTLIQLEKSDITLKELESFVYYANKDLELGSGYGNAIAVRGGSTIQEELNTYDIQNVTSAVITSAGKLKSKFIIHAVGPQFLEKDYENKLRLTLLNVLSKAEEYQIKVIGFPPMGAGFYGVPLNKCADIMLETFEEKFQTNSTIERVIIIASDSREYNAFEKLWFSNKEIGMKL